MAEPSMRGTTNAAASVLGAMIDTGDFPISIPSPVVASRGATNTEATTQGATNTEAAVRGTTNNEITLRAE